MRFLSILLVAALLLAGAGLGVAQAQTAAAEVTVTLGGPSGEYTITLSSTSLPANTPITFTVTNKGKIPHEVVLEKAGANDQPLSQNNKELELEDIAPGETKTATWTIPESGDYQLGCHITGHYEAGMVAKFTVVAQTAATAVPTTVVGATSAVTPTVTVATTSTVSPTATVAATAAVSPTATSVATATVATGATATPITRLPTTGGTGSLPGYLVLGGVGLLLVAGALLLRRRLA